MRSHFFIVLVLAFFLVLDLAAQTKTTAERLGYPADSKLLIIHADDLGTAHSEDAASFDAFDKNVITSASIMIPTPWVTEVANYAKAHPDADLGLHLTLTAEWKTYRWGPVAPSNQVASLLDSDGTFFNQSQLLAAHAKPQEAEREIRAQIDRAIALGIRPTHLDSHMASLFTTPELFAVYLKVAHDYHLPFLAGFDNTHRPPGLSDKDVVPDTVIIADPSIPRDHWKDFYLNTIKNVKPGFTELVVHLGYDNAELQAVMVDNEAYGAAWRQRDYDVLNSAEFKKALQDNHIILIKWRDIQKLIN